MDWYYKRVFYIKYKNSGIEETLYIIADSIEDAIKKFHIMYPKCYILTIELGITVAEFEDE